MSDIDATPAATTAASPAAARPRPRSRHQRARSRAPYLFIAPFFLLFAVFGLFPLVFSIVLSLHQWDPADGLAAMRWVGLENYLFALTDPWFRQSLWNTLWLAIVAGVPQHLVAVPLAYFIHTATKKSRNALVGAYFVPYITSSVAIALIFVTLFSKDYGVINGALQSVFGIGPVDWLGNRHTTKPAVALIVLWRYLGWNVVLYLSALQVIDKELYEAAALDGCGPVRQFWHIALPLLKPMMFFAVTLTLIGNLQLFEEPFILVAPESGASLSVMTTAIFMYRLAFSDGDFGTASAVSWLLFLMIAGLTWCNSRLFGSRDGHHAA